MGNLWDRLEVWWQGKKTILGGCLVMAAAVVGVWFGKLDPVTGLGVLGAGLSISGFSAKANRHQAELLTALQGVAQVGADTRAGDRPKALQDAELTVGSIAVPMVQGVGIPGFTGDQLAAIGAVVTKTLKDQAAATGAFSFSAQQAERAANEAKTK